MAKNKNVWDKLAWIVLLLILVWLVLKVLGIINTPLWLEYSPLFGAVYLAGWAISKLDSATNDIKEMNNEIKDMKEEISTTNKELGAIKTHSEQVKIDIDKIRKKCPALSAK